MDFFFDLFSESFEDALLCLNRRRNIPPALYNQKRVIEYPIPSVALAANHNNDHPTEEPREDETDLGSNHLEYEDSDDSMNIENINTDPNGQEMATNQSIESITNVSIPDEDPLSINLTGQKRGNVDTFENVVQLVANRNNESNQSDSDLENDQLTSVLGRNEGEPNAQNINVFENIDQLPANQSSEDNQRDVNLENLPLSNISSCQEIDQNAEHFNISENIDELAANRSNECNQSDSNAEHVNDSENIVQLAANQSNERSQSDVSSENGQLNSMLGLNEGGPNAQSVNISGNFDQLPAYQSSEHSQSDIDLEIGNERQQYCSLNDIAPENASVKLEPVVLYEPYSSNSNELEDVLENPVEEECIVEEIDEDLTISFYRKTGFAKPYNTNSDGLVKRENDVVSGNLPYSENVCCYLILLFLHVTLQNIFFPF